MSDTVLSDFSDLLLDLYGLSQRLAIDEFQDAALTLIRPVVPFDTSMWGTATITPVGIDIHSIHLHRTGPEMLVAYEEHKAHDRAAASLTGHRQATGGFHAPVHLPDPGLRDFTRRFGHENLFITAKTDPVARFTHWISLFRADVHQHCTEDERVWLERLRPHLMQALALNRIGHQGRLAPATAGLARGQAIADLRGMLQHADECFTTLLRGEWPGWQAGALPQALLQPFLRGERVFKGASVVVQHHLEHQLLFLHARPRCRADTLSARELEVAQLVAQGNSHKAVAQHLRRAPATVRNHMQAVYGKLEVNNVAGLVDALRRAGAL